MIPETNEELIANNLRMCASGMFRDGPPVAPDLRERWLAEQAAIGKAKTTDD